jgi:hypothetical protein
MGEDMGMGMDVDMGMSVDMGEEMSVVKGVGVGIGICIGIGQPGFSMGMDAGKGADVGIYVDRGKDISCPTKRPLNAPLFFLPICFILCLLDTYQSSSRQ